MNPRVSTQMVAQTQTFRLLSKDCATSPARPAAVRRRIDSPVMVAQATSKESGSSEDVLLLREELARSREEVLRLRELLICQDAELGTLRVRQARARAGAARRHGSPPAGEGAVVRLEGSGRPPQPARFPGLTPVPAPRVSILPPGFDTPADALTATLAS